MKKWLFGFLGVALIVFCSVFGYVSYQKHEGEVFKQNIEKKMPVDQINAHAKSYKEDATNVNNDMSLGQMLSIQKEAIEMSVAKSNFKNLMKFIIDDNNIFLAYRNIKKNKGSATAGYDGVTIKDIEKLACGDFLTIIKRRFKDYRPRKVKRVEIPKPNGKLRPLGIPSIWDRIVQQCILQILEPICEAKFNKHSYGFRPNCSTENAIADCLARINQSKMNYVVDIDIKGFFDEVNHTKLMRQIWTMGIRDKQLLVIIRKMLKAPIVMRNGNVVFPTKGTPQGGILSPLLANICLNEFDWWIANQWEERTVKELKHHYRKNGAWDKGNIYSKLRSHTSLKEMYLVRYADDFKIFCRTGEEAQRAFYATQKWLRERLKLPISMEKSKVTNLNKAESEFLGFSIRLHKKGKKKVAFTLFFNELFSANSMSGAISDYIISKEREGRKKKWLIQRLELLLKKAETISFL